MMFIIRRLQELARKQLIPLYVCFNDLTKAYDAVDRTLLWKLFARFGVPQKTISVIRQFHDDMRACVRLDDRMCSGWFAVEQSLRQGCLLALRLFNIFFMVVIIYTRFKADKDIMDALVHMRKKTGVEGEQPAERQSRRRRFGVCCTLTMLEVLAYVVIWLDVAAKAGAGCC